MEGFGEQGLYLNLTKKSTAISRHILLLSVFFLLAAPLCAAASDRIKIKSIRYWSSPDYTRVVVDLTEVAQFSQKSLSNPGRLYFDLLNTAVTSEIKSTLPVGDGILKAIRASQFRDDVVRVVLDLEEISDCKAFALDNPSRLVIDVYGKGKQIPLSDVRDVIKKRIVIDAGHGGHDPGAVGPKKLYEKDVVLDIALALKKILAEDESYEVFLTRDKDVFIALEERTAIANKKNADLFVSVHANASPRREAKGIETYMLNWTDDDEANRVAARENQISLKKMKAMNKQMDTVEAILSGLMRESKRDESIKLAHYIQKSLITNLDNQYKDISDLGVKQALFYVLFGARMPSVLVEVSFISNPVEEALLSKECYRTEIAKAIAEGIQRYFSSAPPVQTVVDLRRNN